MTVEVRAGGDNTWPFWFYFRLKPGRRRIFSLSCEITLTDLKLFKCMKLYQLPALQLSGLKHHQVPRPQTHLV